MYAGEMSLGVYFLYRLFPLSAQVSTLTEGGCRITLFIVSGYCLKYEDGEKITISYIIERRRLRTRPKGMNEWDTVKYKI